MYTGGTINEETKKRTPHPFVYFLASLGALFLLGLLFFIVIIGMGVYSLGSLSQRTSSSGKYVVPSALNKRIVAGVTIHGPLDADVAAEVIEKLDVARKNDKVVGVLLDVNSPGGAVVASQEIYDFVWKLREELPVVAYVRDIAASGAYYAIASSRWIVANRGSLVGSIGVIFSSLETSQLLEWLKLRPVTLKTGKLKDAGSSVRPMGEEEKAYLQKLLDDTRLQFENDVRQGRANLKEDNLQYMRDGRVILGTEALERGFIDALGTRSDAVAKVAELAVVSPKDVELEYIEKEPTFWEQLSRSMESKTTIRLAP